MFTSKYDKILTKTFLEKELIEKGKSTFLLSQEIGCYISTIYKYLYKFKIDIKEDLSGKEFGKLTVVSKDNKRWLCRCKCGHEKSIIASELLVGNHSSCGDKKCKANYTGYKELTGSFYGMMKRNAKIRNLEFNVSKKYLWDLFLKQDKKCALSGIELSFEPSLRESTKKTASLDRIDNSKGYIEGNVQWVHKDINMMKHKLKQEYFIHLCNLISSYNKHG